MFVPLWSPPTEFDFFRVADEVYSTETVQQLKLLNKNILRQLADKHLLPSDNDLHGEFRDFDLAPRRDLVREHFNHLRLFEFLFKKKLLKLADIGCGSGDFSKMARHFGHNCLATETPFNLYENELATYFDHLSFTRHQRRRLYNLNEYTLSIRPQELTHLNSHALDVIYLSQCVFHFPELNKTKKSWIEKDWYFLLTDLANYLQPEGLIFMSLVDPCYKTLPPLLANFYIDYSVVFPDWGAAWWPLLIIQKQNLLRYLQHSKQNSKAGEDLGWENINQAQFMKDTKNKISDLIKIN